MKKFFLLSACLLLIPMAQAQVKPRFSLGFEIGGADIAGDINNRENIRQDVGSYSHYYHGENSGNISISNFGKKFHFGIKPEISFFNKRVSLFSGLRFSTLNANLIGGGAGGYFYLRYKTVYTSTEYARVKSISENADYLSVPLEIRFVPVQISNFGFYAKIGSEIGLKVHSSKKIDFFRESMQTHQTETLGTFEKKPNNFYSTLHGSFGVRWTLLNNMDINLEAHLPAPFITENNLTVISPAVSKSGVQFSVMFPLGTPKTTSKQ